MWKLATPGRLYHTANPWRKFEITKNNVKVGSFYIALETDNLHTVIASK